MQRPSRALENLEEEEVMVLSPVTTPAAWSCLASCTPGPACSPLPPSPPPGPGLVPCTSTTNTCTLCRLTTCHTRCLTPTPRARTSPTITSSYLRYHHHRHRLLHRSATGETGGGAGTSQERSQTRTEMSTRDLCLTCCPRMSTHPGLHCTAEPQECRRWM